MLVKRCENCGDIIDIENMIFNSLIDLYFEEDCVGSFRYLNCPTCNEKIDLGEDYCAKIYTKEEIKQTYDEGYKSGFNDGHDLGCKDISDLWGEQHRMILLGKEVKFQDAFDKGYKIGYNDGYQDAEDVYGEGK